MFRRLIFLVALAGILTIGVREYIIEGIYVASGSMLPTLTVGTNYFLEKISIKYKNPGYGDIIVFPSPVLNEHGLIKRLIGLPGDIIEIKEKIVYRNGIKLYEPYVQHTRINEMLKGDNIGPLTVSEGMAFVMGDNRDESGDSRDWKDKDTGEHIYFIPLSSIQGKIIQFI